MSHPHPLTPQKPAPKGWPRISSSIFYDDAASAIDWLCEAFGFEIRVKIEGKGGRIEHCELDFGEGMIMIGSTKVRNEKDDLPAQSPKTAGCNTQVLCVAVDDADAHCAHARAVGAIIATEPKIDDYGEDYWSDRTYRAIDPEGHHWWFLQRLREPGGKA